MYEEHMSRPSVTLNWRRETAPDRSQPVLGSGNNAVLQGLAQQCKERIVSGNLYHQISATRYGGRSFHGLSHGELGFLIYMGTIEGRPKGHHFSIILSCVPSQRFIV